MISLERQERDAQSGDEKGGAARLTASLAGCLRRQHSKFYVTRCAARSCSLNCEDFFSHLPASWNTRDPLLQNVWQSLRFFVYLRPCVQALSSALRLFDQTYPLILIFNERRKSASRLPLAEHVTSLDNLYACNCIRQPRNTPFRCSQFNPCQPTLWKLEPWRS